MKRVLLKNIRFNPISNNLPFFFPQFYFIWFLFYFALLKDLPDMQTKYSAGKASPLNWIGNALLKRAFWQAAKEEIRSPLPPIPTESAKLYPTTKDNLNNVSLSDVYDFLPWHFGAHLWHFL